MSLAALTALSKHLRAKLASQRRRVSQEQPLALAAADNWHERCTTVG